MKQHSVLACDTKIYDYCSAGEKCPLCWYPDYLDYIWHFALAHPKRYNHVIKELKKRNVIDKSGSATQKR